MSAAIQLLPMNRIGLGVWLTEQAAREIYLKAFQAPVEDCVYYYRILFVFRELVRDIWKHRIKRRYAACHQAVYTVHISRQYIICYI